MDRVYQIKSNDVVFDESNVVGMVKLIQQANTQTNLSLGSCASAELAFEAQDLSMSFPHIEGKEFVYSISDISPYTFTDKTDLIFRDGDIYYFADKNINEGYFTADKPERVNDTRWKISMHDRMMRFDKSVDGFKCENKTIGTILTELCAFCNVPYVPIAFPNSTYIVGKNFTAENLTGRDVLKWIGEASARFFVIDEGGYLKLKFYTNSDAVVDNSNTFELKVSDYCTDVINKVQVKSTENDIGVIVGTGDNCYMITDNPLMYAISDAQLRPVVTNIYNEINKLSYIPLEATVLKSNVDVNIGDIITVNSYREKGLKTVVMSTTKTLDKVIIKSTGDKRITAVSSVNKVIKRLAGKTSEIINTVDEFGVTLSEVKDGLNVAEASIKINANAITSEVTSRTRADETLSSKITQTATSIASEVTSRINADEALSSRIIQTATSITTEITNRTNADGKLQTQITQTADQISMKVSKTDFNGNTVASLINQSATTIQINANKINLVGYITATNLQVQGQTIINGGNITTGALNGWSLTNYGTQYPSLVAGSGLKLELVAGENPQINFAQTSMFLNEFYDSYAGSSRYGLAINGPLLLADYGYGQTRLIIANPASASSGSNAVFVPRSDLGGHSLGMVTSSIKYKSNLKDIDDKYAFDVIMKLMPKTFDFKGEEKRTFGLIAEEVSEIDEFLTVFNSDGLPESVQYHMIGVYLIGAFRYLIKKMEGKNENRSN